MRTIDEIMVLKGYRLKVIFQSGDARIFDFKQFFNTENVFSKLKDEYLFRNVKNRKYFVEWQDEIDISADTLFLEGVPVPHVQRSLHLRRS
jgi:hypothetical protein